MHPAPPARQLWFYHYHFSGVKDPITVLASNRIEALQILQRSRLPPEYQGKQLEGETTSQAVVDVSTMKINGKTYVWVGPQPEYPAGWKEKEEDG